MPISRLLIAASVLLVGTIAAAQTPSAAADSLRANARVLGSGTPVVLVGGGLLGADGWGGVPAVLANAHRVINVQSLAVQYGLDNQLPPAGYSLRAEVSALRATLDSMGVEQADIIAMSHGAVTALLFALDSPRHVRTLTLIEPPAFWLLPNHGNDEPGAADMQRFIGSLRGATIEEHHVEQFRCLLGDCGDGRSPRQSAQWNQWVRYRNSLRALHTLGDYNDDPARLRTLHVPTLVVHGSATVPFHRRINASLLKLLPNGRPLELGGGHNSPAASPDFFVAEWRKFAQPASPGGGAFDVILKDVETAQVRLVNGDPAPFKALWSHADDVTLSGGLGGAIAKGWKQVSERLDWVAGQYRDGARTHQEISRIVGQDLAYVVLRETIRFKNPADGRATVQQLRVSQVFRREGGQWRIVHRHADSQTTTGGR